MGKRGCPEYYFRVFIEMHVIFNNEITHYAISDSFFYIFIS